MFEFVKDFRISKAVVIVAAVPMIAVTAVVAKLLHGEFVNYQQFVVFERLVELSTDMSNLVHEQQKERGATAVYLGSGGKEFQRELEAQRQQTDIRRDMLLETYSELNKKAHVPAFLKNMKELVADLSRMTAIRQAIDQQQIEMAEAIQYYTSLNSLSLAIIGENASRSPIPSMVGGIVSFSNYLQGKERAGIERAVGAAGFAAGSFDAPALDKFKELISAQAIYFDAFVTYATKDQKILFDKVMTSDAAKKIDRMRAIAVSSGPGGNTTGVNGKEWFAAMTTKINGLKQVEDSIAGTLHVVIAQRVAAETRILIASSIIAALATVVVIAMCLIIVRAINQGFRSVIEPMLQLANGELEIELPKARPNEIGEIVGALEVFKRNSREQRRDNEKKLAWAHKVDAATGVFEQQARSVFSGLTGASDNLGQLANEIGTAATDAARNVQAVASAAEQMSGAAGEIAQLVARSRDVVEDSVDKTNRASELVKTLCADAEEIVGIVGLISSIAEQTNLLALNATIESARAGEAGKGFAVVAQEVKALAARTATATDEVKAKIEAIRAGSTAADQAMDVVSETISEVDIIAGTIAGTAEEQSATTNDIALNAQQAADRTQTVAEGIDRKNSDHVESATVQSAISEMAAQSSKLNSCIEKFIAEVRAA